MEEHSTEMYDFDTAEAVSDFLVSDRLQVPYTLAEYLEDEGRHIDYAICNLPCFLLACRVPMVHMKHLFQAGRQIGQLKSF